MEEAWTHLLKTEGQHEPLIQKKINIKNKRGATRNQSVNTKQFGDKHSIKETERNKTWLAKGADFQNSDNKGQITDKNSSHAIPRSNSKLARALPTGSRKGKVAFSAYLSHDIYNMGKGHTIKCDKILLNDGNSYSPFTGVFTAPISGVYLLTFNFDVWNKYTETFVKLVKNNNNIVDAIAFPSAIGHDVMGGNTALIHLNKGEAVWLETYGTNISEVNSRDTYRYTTFSGVLLYI